jgi:hypothetical protein
MKAWKVKAESLPERCQVCHQSDCFDAKNNSCSRCQNLEKINANSIPVEEKFSPAHPALIAMLSVVGYLCGGFAGLILSSFVGIMFHSLSSSLVEDIFRPFDFVPIIFMVLPTILCQVGLPRFALGHRLEKSKVYDLILWSICGPVVFILVALGKDIANFKYLALSFIFLKFFIIEKLLALTMAGIFFGPLAGLLIAAPLACQIKRLKINLKMNR